MNALSKKLRTLFRTLLGLLITAGWCGCSIQIGSNSSALSHTVNYGPGRLILKPEDDSPDGRWETNLGDPKHAGRERGIILEIHRRNKSHSGWWREVPDFPQANRAAGGEIVTFEIWAEAGTIKFAGSAVTNRASGQYRFSPDANYAKAASDLLGASLGNEDLLQMALTGLPLDYIRAVQQTGLKVTSEQVLALHRHQLEPAAIGAYAQLGFDMEQLIRLKSHAISPEFVQGVRLHGFGKTVDELVQIRNQAITPEYIGNWKKVEPNLSLAEMIQLRNQAITPEYVVAWRRVDEGMTHSEMIRLRNQAITPEYVQSWRKTGYQFGYDEMIRARNHAITHEFASTLRRNNYSPSLEEMIRLRQHGVSAEYFVEMKKLDPAYNIDELTRFRQNGVTPEFVAGLRKAGYTFKAEEIVKLRNHGVTADYAAALQVPGRAMLDAQTIIDLRNRGVSSETARKLRE